MALVSSFARWLSGSAEVPLVCEIAADYVAAVRHRHGRVEAWATRALPAGAVRPAPLADNIADRGAVQQALESVVGAVAHGGRRCALLVPDLLARVALLEFDHLPARRPEAEALLRWRLGKDLPFDVAQAALSYHAQPGPNGGQEALVAACLRNLLRPYEECVEALGLQPGFVTLSTLAALGGVESADSPRLLVKRDLGSLALAVAHGSAVRLFRCVPLASDAPLSDEALFDKVYSALVYFQDQWGQPLSEVVLAVGSEGGALGQRLEREQGCRVSEYELGAADLPPSPASGAAPDNRLGPAVGWARGMAA